MSRSIKKVTPSERQSAVSIERFTSKGLYGLSISNDMATMFTYLLQKTILKDSLFKG
ncbi:MAG: hypothetical protein H7334_11085 [Ferruginibacter sp.]|nr:hypothetical protein [Ferruginibacter sp.]